MSRSNSLKYTFSSLKLDQSDFDECLQLNLTRDRMTESAQINGVNRLVLRLTIMLT